MRSPLRFLLRWPTGYVLISLISYVATAFSGWRYPSVQLALLVVVIVTLGLDRIARVSSGSGASAEASLALAFGLVAAWLILFVALDLVVDLRLRPGEGYWQGWWGRNGLEILGYVPLFVLVVWSELGSPHD